MDINIRDAEIKDSSQILAWRNHQSSRIFSKNSLPITEAEHDEWYKKRLETKDYEPFWVFTHDSKSIGYVRLENSKKFLNSLEISISIDPEFQKKGFGQKILDLSLLRVFRTFPTKKIVASINVKNLASVSIFQKANFQRIGQDNDFLFFEKTNQSLRFVFRADASVQEGVGHVLRSLGIIEELISQNYKVYFIGKVINVPWVIEKIQSLGFTKIFNEESEYKSNNNSDILILDSYKHDTDSNFINLDNWKSVVLIFDRSTPKYTAQLGIHPGITNDWKLDNLSKILSGPKFIPFRKNISKLPVNIEQDQLVITVVGGGADYKNFVPEMAKNLAKIPGVFTVNLFTNKPNRIVNDPRFKIFELGDSLDLVGNKTHLAFSTASTSSLEFIARGCAVGVSCVTQNQESYYNDLHKLGLAKQIGKYIDEEWELDTKTIEALVVSKEYRESLTKNITDFIDLSGAKRIVQEILSS